MSHRTTGDEINKLKREGVVYKINPWKQSRKVYRSSPQKSWHPLFIFGLVHICNCFLRKILRLFFLFIHFSCCCLKVSDQEKAKNPTRKIFFSFYCYGFIVRWACLSFGIKIFVILTSMNCSCLFMYFDSYYLLFFFFFCCLCLGFYSCFLENHWNFSKRLAFGFPFWDIT